jgi:hypothetical protein
VSAFLLLPLHLGERFLAQFVVVVHGVFPRSVRLLVLLNDCSNLCVQTILIALDSLLPFTVRLGAYGIEFFVNVIARIFLWKVLKVFRPLAHVSSPKCRQPVGYGRR